MKKLATDEMFNELNPITRIALATLEQKYKQNQSFLIKSYYEMEVAALK